MPNPDEKEPMSDEFSLSLEQQIATEFAPWVGTCPAGHVHYRYRRPARALSCGKCSRRFDAANAIRWENRRAA